MIIHAGTSINCGHYYTIAKDRGEWHIYNDSSVTKIEDIGYLEQIEKKFVNDTPYMLVYKRKEEADAEMTVEEEEVK